MESSILGEAVARVKALRTKLSEYVSYFPIAVSKVHDRNGRPTSASVTGFSLVGRAWWEFLLRTREESALDYEALRGVLQRPMSSGFYQVGSIKVTTIP